jgi:hypothetical protein
MPLSSTKTCLHCGYSKDNCVCHKRKNTSGDPVIYQNYVDQRQVDDYAMTARINRTSSEDRKIMDELLPMDGELLANYIKRSDIAASKLTKYSVNHHLYGTKRVWSCHTSSRYCFICTMAQSLEVLRALYTTLEKTTDLSNIYIGLTPDPDEINPPTIHTYTQ